MTDNTDNIVELFPGTDKPEPVGRVFEHVIRRSDKEALDAMELTIKNQFKHFARYAGEARAKALLKEMEQINDAT